MSAPELGRKSKSRLLRHTPLIGAEPKWNCNAGFVRLPAAGASGGVVALNSSFGGGRDTNEIAPATKGEIASGTVLIGGEAVTSELEVVVDPALSGEETLRVAR